MYQSGVIDPNYLDTVQDCGVTLLRYPGGGWGNYYVWNNPDNPAYLMNTDQFIQLCQAIGAEPTITVNLNESVDLAVAWVQYCNVDHNYNIKYWELHDEPWYNQIRGKAYSKLINQFAPAMKAVDPTIKIVACVSCRYPSEESNTTTVVKNAWQNIDVYDQIAFFIGNTEYTYEQRQAYYDDLLYSTPGELVTWLASLRTIVNKYKDPEKPVEYLVGSYNSISCYPADWQVNYLPEGLWVAIMLGTFIEQDDLTIAGFWACQNPYPIKQASYGYVAPDFRPYVSYYAMQLYTYYFGDTLVSSSSSSNDLVVFASTSSHKLHLVLINRDLDIDITTTFTLQNWTPQSTARAWILDGPTEPDELPGRVLGYSIRTEDITGVFSEFTWTVPSYSAVAIELPDSQGNLSTGTPPHGTQRAGMPPYDGPGGDNLALGKPTTASTHALLTMPIDYSIDAFDSERAVDADRTYTRWASKIWWKTSDYSDPTEWFQLDLEQATTFNRIILKWSRWATNYTISVSNDGVNWTQIATQNDAVEIKPAPEPWHQIDVTTRNARYIKLKMTKYATSYPHAHDVMSAVGGYALFEFEVYNI